MTGVINNLLGVLMFRPITGPIAGKELRVASRMRRYYLMRIVYLVLLLVIVCVGWLAQSRNYYGQSASVYLAEMAMRICVYAMKFQFFAAHIVMILLLSDAISEEIDKRSLGVLLTTPINGFQIAGGKVFSRFIFIFQLLCLSLPVLAIVRVLGGIDWNFIISMFILTVVSVFFVSTVTICIATFFKHAYVTMIMSALIIAGYYWSYHYWPIRKVMYELFNAVPFLGWLVPSLNPYHLFEGISFKASPTFYYRAMKGWTFYLGGIEDVSSVPAILLTGWFYYVQVAMIAMLSLGILFVAGRRIRKVAVKQLTRTRKPWKRRVFSICELIIQKLPRIGIKKGIRTVHGDAMVWKEMHHSLFRGELLRGRGIYFILIGTNLIVFALLLLFFLFGTADVFRITIIGAVIGSLLITAVVAASMISREKQTSSWQILLCTPLSDGEIIKGKMAGMFRRAGIYWIGLVLLIGILAYAELCPFSSLLLSGIIGVEFFIFLTGVGIYFSVICKKTANAVLMSLIVGALLWIVPPIFIEVAFRGYSGWWITDFFIEANPVYQVTMAIEGEYLSGHFLTCPNCTFLETYGASTLSVVVYVGTGLFLLYRAKRKLRKFI